MRSPTKAIFLAVSELALLNLLKNSVPRVVVGLAPCLDLIGGILLRSWSCLVRSVCSGMTFYFRKTTGRNEVGPLLGDQRDLPREASRRVNTAWILESRVVYHIADRLRTRNQRRHRFLLEIHIGRHLY